MRPVGRPPGRATRWRLVLGALGLACLTARPAHADAKVEQDSLGPDGDSFGCAISPHGAHVGVLANKGSRYVVLIDGVEGPKIDALLTGVMGGVVGAASYWMGQVPILFCDDGTHSAYSAKMGNDYVIMLDGKELARGPINPSTLANLPLTFSQSGKHLYYMDADAEGKYRIVVDGKPGPSVHIPPQLVLSNGGEHYAYLGYERAVAVPNWAVVDGRQVNFFGDNLQYTGLGVLLSRMSVNGAAVMLINGKPMLKAYRLDPTWISPDGHEIAMMMAPNSGDPTVLTVNGKIIPDTQGLGIEKVYFSADGKRYAALCDTKAGSRFMIIDGKRGGEYQTIPPQAPYSGMTHWVFVNGVQPMTVASVAMPVPGFTADSSKFVYVAVQGARQFMIVEDQESNGFQGTIEPILSAAGHRIGVVGVASNGKQHVIIDDKELEYGPTAMPGGGPMRIHDLNFTPDGAGCAFVNGANLWFNGATLPGYIDGAHYTFSPDDKHIAYLASDSANSHFFLDGKIIDSKPGNLTHPFFSPDSRHLVWVRTSNIPGTKDSSMLYMDGKPAMHFSDSGLGGGAVTDFEFSPDGTLVFVARSEGNLRRFHVTPSADANIDTLLASGTAPKP